MLNIACIQNWLYIVNNVHATHDLDKVNKGGKGKRKWMRNNICICILGR